MNLTCSDTKSNAIGLRGSHQLPRLGSHTQETALSRAQKLHSHASLLERYLPELSLQRALKLHFHFRATTNSTWPQEVGSGMDYSPILELTNNMAELAN